MKTDIQKPNAYRWAVMLAFMAVVAINQLLWITYAPVTSDAAKYYNVSTLSIGLLSMSFMIVYILVSIPASWVIDRFGIRIAVGIGAVLTGIFGLLRGLAGSNYSLALFAQIMIAVGQPFILNAITSVAARWFAPDERATASGLGSLSIYLGILAGMLVTPLLALRFGFSQMLLIYGILSLLPVVTFFLFVKERPANVPASTEPEVRSLMFDGLRETFKNRNFLLLLAIFFVGLGAFNAVTTWIEDLLKPRGFTITQAGVTGGMMIIGGIIGAVVMPTLSDKKHKRVPFILASILGATLGLAGVTYASSYLMLLASAFVLGFFLLSAGPIGFQFGAEITRPVPEGTSNGLLLLMGQISGILFIFGMELLKSPETGSMTGSLNVLLVLMVAVLLLCTRLKEPASV
ncbi:MAG: MFS transporter [Anaerolineaceae bacterium]|nr:MFS transporter [Anaerolineaceae bacterium]